MTTVVRFFIKANLGAQRGKADITYTIGIANILTAVSTASTATLRLTARGQSVPCCTRLPRLHAAITQVAAFIEIWWRLCEAPRIDEGLRKNSPADHRLAASEPDNTSTNTAKRRIPFECRAVVPTVESCCMRRGESARVQQRNGRMRGDAGSTRSRVRSASKADSWYCKVRWMPHINHREMGHGPAGSAMPSVAAIRKATLHPGSSLRTSGAAALHPFKSRR